MLLNRGFRFAICAELWKGAWNRGAAAAAAADGPPALDLVAASPRDSRHRAGRAALIASPAILRDVVEWLQLAGE